MKVININILIIIFYFINCNCLISQNYITINGTVTDKDSIPISAVNIYTSEKSIATISNTEGEYKFSVPKRLINDTLMFSCLGYNTKKIPINSIIQIKNYNIVLEPSVYLLNEVIVNNKELSASEILNQAKLNYYNKYIPSIDYNAYMYFREYIKEDTNYVRAKEAAIKTYSKANIESIELKLYKCRFSQESKYATSPKGDLGLGIIFQFSWLFDNYFRNKDIMKAVIKLDTTILYHNKLVYVISVTKGDTKAKLLKDLYLKSNGNDYLFYNSIVDSFKYPATKYSFNIYYISVDGFKIEKMFTYFSSGIDTKTNYKSTSEYVDFLRNIKSIEFIEKNNEMYPYHLFYFGDYYIYNSKYSENRVLKHIYNELINNEISVENVEKIPENSLEKIISDFYFHNECIDDDFEFWKNYNYLPDDKLKKQVIESLQSQKNN